MTFLTTAQSKASRNPPTPSTCHNNPAITERGDLGFRVWVMTQTPGFLGVSLGTLVARRRISQPAKLANTSEQVPGDGARRKSRRPLAAVIQPTLDKHLHTSHGLPMPQEELILRSQLEVGMFPLFRIVLNGDSSTCPPPHYNPY